MVNKPTRQSDGLYHIKGKTYKNLFGKRAQVWHGNAYKTKGELLKKDLLMNKRGRIVSKKKHSQSKKEKRLEKAGYFTKKGQFGFVRKNETAKKGKRKARK